MLLHHMRCLAILVRYPVTSAPGSTSYLWCDSCVWLCCELDQGTDLLLKKKNMVGFLKPDQLINLVHGISLQIAVWTGEGVGGGDLF